MDGPLSDQMKAQNRAYIKAHLKAAAHRPQWLASTRHPEIFIYVLDKTKRPRLVRECVFTADIFFTSVWLEASFSLELKNKSEEPGKGERRRAEMTRSCLNSLKGVLSGELGYARSDVSEFPL